MSVADIVYQKRTIVIVVFYLLHVQTACSPADGADHAEECSKLYYFAEKDRLFEVKAVLGFVCVNLRDLRETY